MNIIDLNFDYPVRLLAGEGKISELAHITIPGNTLIITSPSFTKRGVTKSIADLLSEQEITVFDAIRPNPGLDELDDLTNKFRKQKFSSIIALGGGSVIDSAKVLSVSIPSKIHRPLHSIFRNGLNLRWEESIPIIAVPTTSGTGSEVTPYATVWDKISKKKYSLSGEIIYPKFAILDPILTLSLSSKLTLYPALDTISHALESIWNKNSTKLSIEIAVKSLDLVNRSLPKVLVRPADLKSRYLMQQASFLAGFAVSKTQTAIAHSISYPLTGHYDIPHGLACSFTLSKIFDFVTKEKSFKFPEQKLVEQTIRIISDLNLKKELLKYVSPSQVRSIYEEMYSPARADNFKFNISQKNIESIVNKSIN